MKKLLLSFGLVAFGTTCFSQVVLRGVSPASVVGNIPFGVQAGESIWPGETNDATWNVTAPDFNIDGTFIQDTLVFVNDGAPGNNTTYPGYSWPSAEEGCAASTANAYAGKIAVIRRGTCDFSSKVFNAQNAGAIAVIIVNRPNENGSFGMLGGASGTSVTIPAVGISYQDGQDLIDAIALGATTVFLGNKFTINANDIGSTTDWTNVSKQATRPALITQSGADYSFTPGIQMVNYANVTETNVSVNAKIDGPGLPGMYNETVVIPTIAFKDTVAIFEANTLTFPTFSPASYPVGEYTLTYSINLASDEDLSDNIYVSKFYVTEGTYSYASADLATGKPVVNSHPRNYEVSYESCIRFQDPNASRLGVDGVWFSMEAADSILATQEALFYAYGWDDAVTTFPTTGNMPEPVREELASGSVFPDASYVSGTVVKGSFETPFVLVDNKNYLFCVATSTPALSFGYDNNTNYNFNNAVSEEIITPIRIQNTAATTWFAAGWSGTAGPTTALSVFPSEELGLNNNAQISASVFPNPANENVKVVVTRSGKAVLNIMDNVGRLISNNNVTIVNGQLDTNVSNFSAGSYIFTLSFENGEVATVNVMVTK